MKMESFYIEEISDELMERMKGKSFKDDCSVPREDLRYLHVLHKNLANELSVQDLEKTLCKISVIYINHKTIMFDLSIKTRKFQ